MNDTPQGDGNTLNNRGIKNTKKIRMNNTP